MNSFKKAVVSLLILGTLITTVNAFEQNGVKEGNDRISIGLTSIIDNDDGSDGSGTLYGQYGKFITEDIEIGAYIFVLLNDGDVTYQIAPGINYYFLKTPTLTPYVGVQYYYTDSTKDVYKNGKKVDLSSDGDNFHIGLHKFFNENLAVSPEVGMRFIDFTDYTQSYANIYLTYFFD